MDAAFTMRLVSLFMVVFLRSTQQVLAQNFSDFAHDCTTTGFNEDFSSTFGLTCKGSPPGRPQMSYLSLNNCLSFDSPNIVGHQGSVIDEMPW